MHNQASKHTQLCPSGTCVGPSPVLFTAAGEASAGETRALPKPPRMSSPADTLTHLKTAVAGQAGVVSPLLAEQGCFQVKDEVDARHQESNLVTEEDERGVQSSQQQVQVRGSCTLRWVKRHTLGITTRGIRSLNWLPNQYLQCSQ